MSEFLSGAFMLASAAIAAFFLRFWRMSGDRLFAILSLAFSMLAIERTVLAFVSLEHEGRHWIYVARLLAFVLIILGIADKNRVRRKPPDGYGPRGSAGSRDGDLAIPGDSA